MARMIRAMTQDGSARALIIDGRDIVNRAIEIHNTAPTATAALGRVLLATSLMGSLMGEKEDAMTLRFQGDGEGGTILAASDYMGNVRGLIGNPHCDLPLRQTDGKLDVAKCVGNGYLTVIRDAGGKDKYIAGMALDSSVEALTASPTLVTKENVLSILDDAIEKLQENDVNMASGISITVSPRFYKLFKQAYVSNDTNNSQMLENGKIAMYGSVTVKLSNNVAKTESGTVDNIMIRSKRAIAFVNPLTHTEAYRPEKSFADAVKGYALFDGKVVRPKEIINVNVKYA